MVCVQGIFIVAGSLLLAAALLLTAPVRFRLDGEATLSGGRVRVRVGWLAFFIRFTCRLSLPEEGPVYLELLNRKGSVPHAWRVHRTKPPGPWGRAVMRALRIRRLGMELTVGTGNAVGLNAALCGAFLAIVNGAGQALLPGTALGVSCVPAWGKTTFLLRARGIASLRPAHIMRERFLHKER